MKTREIVALDLATFQRPEIPGNPSILVRAVWYLLNATVFRSGVAGLVPSQMKRVILRVFGAKVGEHVVIKPRVDIKSPWFLEIGDHVWLGEKVWIDNHTTVRIGSDSCISQGAYLFTGNHDWNDTTFAFFCKPIEIGRGVWITAYVKVPPGSIIPDHVAVMDD